METLMADRTQVPSGDALPAQTNSQPTSLDASLIWLAAVALLLSFAVTMTVVILLYTHDLTTLSQLPEIVWSFLCGVPSENGIILPVLTLLTLATYGSAAVMIAWRIARR